jgi:MFS family permease
MGLVHNFQGLMASRWFLGLTEAGLFPGMLACPLHFVVGSLSDRRQGVNYYLSCWYKRSEFGVRAAIFFSAAALAGSFGGLLAAAIVQMDGIGGKPGWAWIFILEGLATILVASASFFMVCGQELPFLITPPKPSCRYMTSPTKPNFSARTTGAA